MTNSAINNFLITFYPYKRDNFIKMACYCLNGLNEGCCSDKLIKSLTGFSYTTIHKAFKSLENQKKYIPSNELYGERYGTIVPSSSFYSQCIEPFINLPNDGFTSVTGIIQKIEKHTGAILLQSKNGVKYRALCHNEKSPIFFLPIDLNITFQGSLLFQNNDETCVWIDEKSLEVIE